MGTFAKELKSYVLYSGILNRSMILSKISLVVSMLSSVGGFITIIIEVMDKKWDGYITLKITKKKVILV